MGNIKSNGLQSGVSTPTDKNSLPLLAAQTPSLDGMDFDVVNSRGLYLEGLCRYDEALSEFEQILQVDSGHQDALNNKGLVLARLGRFEEALTYFESVLSRYPENCHARYNRSIMLLAVGNLANGFREFEARWLVAPLKDLKHPTPAPLWRGEAVPREKTILLYHEQGYGDTIQFVRYLPMVAARGMKVVLAVPPALRRLMACLPGNPKIVTDGDPMPFHELRCPLMSLPLAFGTTRESIPVSSAYLRADPELVANWRRRLGHSNKPHIGLAWSGRQYAPINLPRDIALKGVNPLLELDANFISLQKDIPETDRTLIESLPKLVRFDDAMVDFADTAALIENLDLVITVDTAIAHLAGALGKPVWILNRYATCWRWPRHSSRSDWYLSARLFRQRQVGQWGGAIEDVVEAATALIATHKPSAIVALTDKPSPPKIMAGQRRASGAVRVNKYDEASDTHKTGVEKIKFVCATRESREDFFSKTALGRSLANFRVHPRGQPIELRMFPQNSEGLSSVYNTAIDESRHDPAILIFIHDDVLICDFFWVERLLEAHETFAIVGLCGNKRRVPGQSSWMYIDGKFTRDDAANLSGVVGHGNNFPALKQLSVYGPPRQEVKLLDGMMLSVRSNVLTDTNLRFDPQFDFHFYDLDFCRQAESRQLKMGTCAISVVHESVGRLGSSSWRKNYKKYLTKYLEQG